MLSNKVSILAVITTVHINTSSDLDTAVYDMLLKQVKSWAFFYLYVLQMFIFGSTQLNMWNATFLAYFSKAMFTLHALMINSHFFFFFMKSDSFEWSFTFQNICDLCVIYCVKWRLSQCINNTIFLRVLKIKTAHRIIVHHVVVFLPASASCSHCKTD